MLGVLRQEAGANRGCAHPGESNIPEQEWRQIVESLRSLKGTIANYNSWTRGETLTCRGAGKKEKSKNLMERKRPEIPVPSNKYVSNSTGGWQSKNRTLERKNNGR